MRTCWVCAPRTLRLPPQALRMTTAGRIACSARQLVASIAGPEEGEEGRRFDRQMGSESLYGWDRRPRGGEQVERLLEQPAARAGEPVRGDVPGRVPVAQRERLLEPLLHASGKRTAGMIELEQRHRRKRCATHV